MLCRYTWGPYCSSRLCYLNNLLAFLHALCVCVCVCVLSLLFSFFSTLSYFLCFPTSWVRLCSSALFSCNVTIFYLFFSPLPETSHYLIYMYDLAFFFFHPFSLLMFHLSSFLPSHDPTAPSFLVSSLIFLDCFPFLPLNTHSFLIYSIPYLSFSLFYILFLLYLPLLCLSFHLLSSPTLPLSPDSSSLILIPPSFCPSPFPLPLHPPQLY